MLTFQAVNEVCLRNFGFALDLYFFIISRLTFKLVADADCEKRINLCSSIHETPFRCTCVCLEIREGRFCLTPCYVIQLIDFMYRNCLSADGYRADLIVDWSR